MIHKKERERGKKSTHKSDHMIKQDGEKIIIQR